jgi:hypothetical protein
MLLYALGVVILAYGLGFYKLSFAYVIIVLTGTFYNLENSKIFYRLNFKKKIILRGLSKLLQT